MSGDNTIVSAVATAIGLGVLAVMYFLFRGTSDAPMFRREPSPPDPVQRFLERIIGGAVLAVVTAIVRVWPYVVALSVLYFLVRFVKWAWTD